MKRQCLGTGQMVCRIENGRVELKIFLPEEENKQLLSPCHGLSCYETSLG